MIECATGTYDDYHANGDDDEDEDDEEKLGGEAEGSQSAAVIFCLPAGPRNETARLSRCKQPSIPQKDIKISIEQQQQRPHAAVEKRYRSDMNSKIQQLNDSIPASNTFSLVGPKVSPKDYMVGAPQKVPTKSVVLDRAMQYINHLAFTYEQYETECNELRRKLQFWLDNVSTVGSPETTDM